MDIAQAKAIVEKYEREEREYEEAKEFIRHTAAVEQDRRRYEAQERAEQERQAKRAAGEPTSPEEVAVLAAIAFLEPVIAEYTSKIKQLEARSGPESLELHDLRVSLRQLTQGLDANEGADASIWKVLSDPRILRCFHFAQPGPGLNALRSKLKRLRADESQIAV
jgi:hypothetical protein